uniref:Uncharacterized protein n=1 Tax=Rhizophora mucronata TaxID=61149 RepID=A0A2P2PV61_RHIMU
MTLPIGRTKYDPN